MSSLERTQFPHLYKSNVTQDTHSFFIKIVMFNYSSTPQLAASLSIFLRCGSTIPWRLGMDFVAAADSNPELSAATEVEYCKTCNGSSRTLLSHFGCSCGPGHWLQGNILIFPYGSWQPRLASLRNPAVTFPVVTSCWTSSSKLCFTPTLAREHAATDLRNTHSINYTCIILISDLKQGCIVEVRYM